MTLALLLTAVTGAWATEFTSLKVGDVLHVGDAINTGTNYKVYGLYLDAGYQPATLVRANIGTNDITESETGAYYLIKGNNDFYYGIIWGDGLEGGYWPVTDTSDGISVTAITPGDYTELTFAVHEGTAEPPLTVEWNASTKTGTFAMPGSDVVLTPIYAKAAAFATTGTEPDVKTLLPEAAEGVIADTDAPLIKEGTGIVAFAGTSTTVTQGTLMYAVTPATVTEAPALDAADKWSADVPTAKTVADGGADVYVWYYIQGADTPDGETPTADNTFNDSEICTTPLTVTVRSNKFDLAFKAANANTIEAGKATVTVGGTAATVTDGKLEAVKMGSEVKMTAKEGYKFRKVEVKKKASESLIVNPEVGQIIGSDGKNYNVADVPTGVEKVAMIAYVGSETGHDTYKSGLAIALRDEGEMDWATAKSTCEAKSTFTNAAWMVPSVPQWMAMCTATGNNGNAYYGSMKYAMIAAAGEESSFKEDDYQYWSSSEGSSSTAYCFGLKDDSTNLTSVDKNNIKGVRAVLAF